MSTKPLFLPNRQVQIIKSSYTDDSHHNRRQESDAEHPKFSQTEFRTVRLDLRKQILRFPFPAYIVAHRESTERHQNIIRYQSGEIKDRLIQDCDITQDAEGQRTRNAKQRDRRTNHKRRMLAFPAQRINRKRGTDFRSAIALVTAAKKTSAKNRIAKKVPPQYSQIPSAVCRKSVPVPVPAPDRRQILPERSRYPREPQSRCPDHRRSYSFLEYFPFHSDSFRR